MVGDISGGWTARDYVFKNPIVSFPGSRDTIFSLRTAVRLRRDIFIIFIH